MSAVAEPVPRNEPRRCHCGERASFGYKDRNEEWTWYCGEHRLRQWSADACDQAEQVSPVADKPAAATLSAGADFQPFEHYCHCGKWGPYGYGASIRGGVMSRTKSSTSQAGPSKSWREVLPLHPAALEYPPIGKDELADLGTDIKARGLQVEVVLILEGGKLSLLDGRSRLDAIEAAGINLVEDGNIDRTLGLGGGDRVRIVTGVDPRVLAASLNAHRRHLTPEKRRERIEALLQASPEKSDRQIAEEAETDHKVVGRARKRLESTGAAPQLTKRVGADGKTRRQPTREGRPQANKGGRAESGNVGPPPMLRSAIGFTDAIGSTGAAMKAAVFAPPAIEARVEVTPDPSQTVSADPTAARIAELEHELAGLRSKIEELQAARKPKLAPEGGEAPLHCSFCGKSQHEVRWLIQGPPINAGTRAFICAECASICVDVAREEDACQARRKAAESTSASTESDVPPVSDASPPATPPATEPEDDGLLIPPWLRREPVPAAAGAGGDDRPQAQRNNEPQLGRPAI